MKLFRRIRWLALIGAGGVAGLRAWQRRSQPAVADGPNWPPLTPTKAPTVPVDRSFVATPVVEARTVEAEAWVEPVDGQCPVDFPIKANDNSMIFHMPDGRSYERTIPERCYANADDAIADGYRAAKV